MARSKMVSSVRGKPKRRVRLPRARTQPISVAPKLEPGAPSDFELMKGIQTGDADALSELYDRYNGILKALILRVIHNEAEADDLLQEIFMEIWNQAKNFSAQKGKPLAWMVTLARRRAIDGLRKKQAYARAEERLKNETEQQPDAWVHNATEEEIVLSDTRLLIRKVISGLPPAQQQAIDLAFFRGMSQREIAAKTNTPLGTVKTRLELGLKKIYEGLKDLRDELSAVSKPVSTLRHWCAGAGGTRAIRESSQEIREEGRRLHHQMLRIARSICTEPTSGEVLRFHKGAAHGHGKGQK